MPARIRTISPSAQKVTPSPYAGHRPECHQIVSLSPSTYFASSQVSRDLPMPPIPVTDTTRALPSRPVACSSSFSKRSSSVRPTNGGSIAIRFAPSRSATTRKARHAPTGASFPFRASSPTASNAIAREAARKVASPTSTVPGSAADWSRDAVFTMSPVTMPSFVPPAIVAASPVSTPPRACSGAPVDAPSAATASTSSNAHARRARRRPRGSPGCPTRP